MKIGVVKEIKDQENRVAVTPEGVMVLVAAGHSVLIQQNAGFGSGFSDQQYVQAGAAIAHVDDTWNVDLVVKVKEPLESEYQYLQGQLVFTFFHLAGVPVYLTERLLATQTTAIAYETLEDDQGRLPILAPMSAVAGNMAALMGSYYLAEFNQGKGMQLGMVMGKRYGKVLVIGDGIVGQHAANVANSMGAHVIMASLAESRINQLENLAKSGVNFIPSNPRNIAMQTRDADLVIGAVLKRGEKAQYVVTEEMVKNMQPGSVLVDVSIDQGGCIETSKPTSHSAPVFIYHNIIHYCVTNMPGAYPRTSTLALSEVTLPYLLKLANNGINGFLADKNLSLAINTYAGKITYQQVAVALDMLDKYEEIK
jgi:alanine dehydrogenase